MALITEPIGNDYKTIIPSLNSDASITDAFKAYHLGLNPITGSSASNSIEGHFAAANNRSASIEYTIGYVSASISSPSVHTRLNTLETSINTTAPLTYLRIISQTSSPNVITPQTTSTIPLTVKGLNSQSADLQQWQNSSASVIAKIDNDGTLYSYNGLSLDEVVTLSGIQTLSNKTITSASLTGIPIAPTASFSTNTTQIATTAFVKSAIATIDLNTNISASVVGGVYTLNLSDSGKLLEIPSSASVISVPINSSVAFPVGTSISLMQTTTTTVTINPAAGVIIDTTPGYKLRTQWSVATLIKRSTDRWILFGDLMI